MRSTGHQKFKDMETSLTESQRSDVERYGSTGLHRFRTERAQFVRELLDAGHTTRQVATMLGTNCSTVVHWGRQECGAERPITSSGRTRRDGSRETNEVLPLTRSQRARIDMYGQAGPVKFRAERARFIQDLQSKGWSVREIGKLLGVSHTLAVRWSHDSTEPSFESRNGTELVAYLKRNLGKKEWPFVEMLAERGTLDRQSLATAVGHSPRSVRFTKALERLQKLGVIQGGSVLSLAENIREAFCIADSRRFPA